MDPGWYNVAGSMCMGNFVEGAAKLMHFRVSQMQLTISELFSCVGWIMVVWCTTIVPVTFIACDDVAVVFAVTDHY